MPTATKAGLIRPSYQQGFARSANKSARPQDWPGLVFLGLPFLGPSGLTLRDWSGFGNHGILTDVELSTDWTINGERGHVLNFVTDDRVNIPIAAANASLDNIEKITLVFWIHPRTLGGGGEAFLWRKGSNAKVLRLDGSNKLTWQQRINGDNGRWSSPDNSITLNTWNHVVLTYDDSATTNDPVFTVNGDVVATTEEATPGGGAFNDAGADVDIGDHPSISRGFDGFINEIRCYNRLLNATHIKEIYRDSFGIVRLADDMLGSEAAAAAASYLRPHFNQTSVLLRR